jgi:alanyl-tRNA synthetase
MLSGNEIRSTFLKFFAERDHRIVRSSSLVPVNDPTLLFTNAGMNQFKDVFLGLEQREYTRATSSQKCVRAGGKHNDLENVGFTNRHHTFFEMLGNFSFGDYFKKDAIAYAWELITSPNWFGIPMEKLYVTVFDGSFPGPTAAPDMSRDDEAYACWLNQGVSADRIHWSGAADNFWAMGDTGPCGPCSEIHYDMGVEAVDNARQPECTAGNCKFPCKCGRYVEIWNLVFMQYNRDASGFSPLPRPSIDTGAGLERLAAVLQGKISNFDTDLFAPLIEGAGRLAHFQYGTDFKGDASLRIIADHTRAATFLISDGVYPSRDKRGYVLRKILRRGIRHGRLLGIDEPFLHKLVGTVRDEMKIAYPELEEAATRIETAILNEEKQFGRTLIVGWREMEERFGRLIEPFAQQVKRAESNPPNQAVKNIIAMPHKGQASGIRRMTEILNAIGESVVFPGKEAFKLFDTFGVPKEFIEESCRDMGFSFDEEGFETALSEQRTRSRSSWKGGHKEAAKPVYTQIAEAFRTEPDFYYGTTARDCKIEAIVKAGISSSQVFAGEEAEIILDRTPIYAESGGQVADVGALYDNSQSLQVAEVRSAYYPIARLIAHRVLAKEDLRVGDRVAVIADGARREHIKRNHTATHLMHAALRNILGTHVKQAGSLVEPGRLRFDFSHFAAIDAAELRDIEQQVNDEILLNSEIQTDVTTLDDALASGALAFFGDRYPEQNVRVVTIPDPSAPRGFYSKELCGGTHVGRTGDIGVFKIAVEQSTAAGVRRIEAITGAAALANYQRAREILGEITARLGVNEEDLAAAIERAEQAQRQLEKQLDSLKRKGALSKLDDLVAQARTIKGVKVISAEIEGVDRDTMRQLVDSLRQKLGSGVVVLGTAGDGKVALLAGVTKDLTSKLHAGKIIQATAKEVGGSGGGRPDLAEAGGKDTSGLKRALDHVYPLVEQML